MSSTLLQIKIFSPFEVFYEGLAYSLSATNEAGRFDVLFGHANFISLLPKGPVVLNTPYGERSFRLNRGILKVHNNFIVVFANV